MTSQVEVIKDKSDEQGKLLSSQERQAFKMISAGDDLHGQRAVALLAIDEGATQKEAGIRSGLTPGQVKYWLGRFRQLRLEIFPDQVLETVGLDAGQSIAVEVVEPKTEKPKKKKKDKTPSKKGKKSKKKKEAAPKKKKKSKKDKKGKGTQKKKGKKVKDKNK